MSVGQALDEQDAQDLYGLARQLSGASAVPASSPGEPLAHAGSDKQPVVTGMSF